MSLAGLLENYSKPWSNLYCQSVTCDTINPLNATSLNLPNTLVKRDSVGSFSSQGITLTNLYVSSGITSTNLLVSDGSTLSNLHVINGATIAGNFTPLVGIQAITNGSVAPAYTVGEYKESQYLNVNINSGSNWNDATSLTLDAGDWLITHMDNAYPLTNTVDSNIIAITTTAGNNGTGVILGINSVSGFSQGTGRQIATFIQIRENIITPTTYYAKYYSGSNQWSISGKIYAIRIR